MYRTLLISTLMLGSIVSAQSVDPYYNPYPAPAPAPQPGMYYGFPCSSSVDVDVFYGFEGTNHYFSPDMAGAEFTSSLYMTPRQALTFSLLLAAGGDSQHYQYEGDRYHNEFDRSCFELMCGYRFSQPLGRFASVTAGIKGGLDVQYFNMEDYPSFPHEPWKYPDYDADGVSAGFGYAAYVRFGFQVTPYTQFTVGYQFRGATTAPTAEDDHFDMEQKSKAAIWHEVHMGVEIRF